MEQKVKAALLSVGGSHPLSFNSYPVARFEDLFVFGAELV